MCKKEASDMEKRVYLAVGAFLFIIVSLVMLTADEGDFKPAFESFDRDCPVCVWSNKDGRSADKPAEKFKGVFKEGEKCPFCNGAGRITEKIDWKNGYYLVYGCGFDTLSGKTDAQKAKAKAMAKEAARTEALGNAVELASRLNYINLKNLKVADYTSRIRAVVEGAQPNFIKEVVNDDVVFYVVELKVPLWGVKSISAELFDEFQRKFAETKKVKISQTPPRKETDVDITIVIDARAYKNALKPHLFPTVTDKEGRLVYDITRPAKEYVLKEGMVKYVILSNNDEDFNSLKERLENQSTLPTTNDAHYISGDEEKQPSPPEQPQQPTESKKKKKKIVINADEKKLEDATVVVSQDDAKRMEEADKQADSMKKGEVVIIVDSRVAGKEGKLPTLEEVLLASTK
jgi:hypothetical protein